MNLKAVCLPTTSYSWVDGVHLKTKGISLTNVPHYSTESVAEYAVWMMIALAKKIPLILKNNWKLDYSTHLGSEVKGKTVGIVGLGSIGRRIGEMVKALGMNVLYWSRSARDDQFQYAELDEVLEKSDFIFPTLAKSEGTKNLLDAKRISEIKNGAHVVSITGDELFDLPAVLDAIKTDKLGGVAFESEKEEMGNYTGNVLVTPPIAWYTKEALNEDMRIWVDSIISCIQNKPINVVNN